MYICYQEYIQPFNLVQSEDKQLVDEFKLTSQMKNLQNYSIQLPFYLSAQHMQIEKDWS